MRYQETFLPLQFRTILPDRLKAHIQLMSGNPGSVTSREKLLIGERPPVPTHSRTHLIPSNTTQFCVSVGVKAESITGSFQCGMAEKAVPVP